MTTMEQTPLLQELMDDLSMEYEILSFQNVFQFGKNNIMNHKLFELSQSYALKTINYFFEKFKELAFMTHESYGYECSAVLVMILLNYVNSLATFCEYFAFIIALNLFDNTKEEWVMCVYTNQHQHPLVVITPTISCEEGEAETQMMKNQKKISPNEANQNKHIQKTTHELPIFSAVVATKPTPIEGKPTPIEGKPTPIEGKSTPIVNEGEGQISTENNPVEVEVAIQKVIIPEVQVSLRPMDKEKMSTDEIPQMSVTLDMSSNLKPTKTNKKLKCTIPSPSGPRKKKNSKIQIVRTSKTTTLKSPTDSRSSSFSSITVEPPNTPKTYIYPAMDSIYHGNKKEEMPCGDLNADYFCTDKEFLCVLPTSKKCKKKTARPYVQRQKDVYAKARLEKEKEKDYIVKKYQELMKHDHLEALQLNNKKNKKTAAENKIQLIPVRPEFLEYKVIMAIPQESSRTMIRYQLNNEVRGIFYEITMGGSSLRIKQDTLKGLVQEIHDLIVQ